MDANRKKGFSYYFKLDFVSIQGRITTGFMLTVLIAAILIFSTNSFWQGINRQKDKLLNDIKPIGFHSINFLNKLRQTQGNLNLYLYLNDESFETVNKNMWLVDIPTQRDSLQYYINGSNNDEAKIIFATLNRQIGEFKQLQQRARTIHVTNDNPRIVKQFVKTDLVFSLNEIEKTISSLINISNSIDKQMITQSEKQIYYFYRILILSSLLGFIFAYAIGMQFFVDIFKWIRQLREKIKELSYGNLPAHLPPQKNEFKGIANYTNLLIDNLLALKNYAVEVGKSSFGKQYKIFGSHSELGISINEMGTSLQNVSDEERKRNWTNQSLSEFAEILSDNSQDIQNLCREVINNLVKHLNANQGGFFVLIENEDEQYFDLKASYAYDREKFFEKKVGIKEGLIGRVYHEREIVHMQDIPKDYLEISSGLGSTHPNSLILLPLINDEKEIKGLLELAFTQDTEAYQMEFLQRLCSNIASTITVVLANERNQKLLEESQRIAESLQVKEEEARQNAIELNLAREDLNKKLQKINKEFSKLSVIINSTDEAIIAYNQNNEIEFANLQAAEMFGFRTQDLLGRNIKILLPQKPAFDYNLDAYNDTATLEDVKISRKKIEAFKKDGTKFQVFVSLGESEADNEKICILSISKA